MANEAVNSNSMDKTLTKPSIARRFFAGAVDLLIGLVLFFGLFLITYNFIFPSFEYEEKLAKIQLIQKESGLYVNKNNELKLVNDVIKDNESLKEAYDDRIIKFYTYDARAIEFDKLTKYENAKLATSLFIKNDVGEIVEKDGIEYRLFKDFYEEQYDLAVSFLNDNPKIITLANETYATMMIGLVIVLFVSTVIIYLFFPLVLKNNSTIGQLIFKIGLAKTKTNTKPGVLRIIARYIVLFVISFLAPTLIFMKWSYFSLIVVAINIIIMCITRSKIGFQDVVSGTYLVDLRSDYIIKASKGAIKEKDETNSRIEELLKK